MIQDIFSEQKRSREETEKILKNRIWFLNSELQTQEKLLSIPLEFNGFLSDLADRDEETEFYQIIKLEEIYWDEHYAIPKFKVVSKKDGSDYVNSFVGWRRGRFHTLKGLVLFEKDNKISHFLIRNSVRMAVSEIIAEVVGSIYPPTGIEKGSLAYNLYIKEQLEKSLRIPNLNLSKIIELGEVYPDPGVEDNVTKLFAAIVKIEDITEIQTYITDKTYNDKRYDYSFELIKIDDLFEFLGKTKDSFLLAIFGRLQALNVIKL